MMLPIDITARSTHRTVQNQLSSALGDLDDLPAKVPAPKTPEPAEAAAANDDNPGARQAAKGELRTFVENAKKSAAVDNPPPTFVPPLVRA